MSKSLTGLGEGGVTVAPAACWEMEESIPSTVGGSGPFGIARTEGVLLTVHMEGDWTDVTWNEVWIGRLAGRAEGDEWSASLPLGV